MIAREINAYKYAGSKLWLQISTLLQFSSSVSISRKETQFKLKQKLILRNTKMTLLPHFLIQRFKVKDKITRYDCLYETKNSGMDQVKYVKDSLWKIWKGYGLLKSILEYFIPYIIHIDINKLLAALKWPQLVFTLLVRSLQWKHSNKVMNLLKAYNKEISEWRYSGVFI